MILIAVAFKFRLVILFLIAFISTMFVFKPILRIAKSKNIVDNPDPRKLQKKPVPVMGGVAVFFGLAVGLCFYKTMIVYTTLFPVLSSMIIMLYLGSIDDILSIKPGTRFFIEMLVASTMLFGLKWYIADFQGLWGINLISPYIGVPLTVLTFLGIVNAINMIDGIDGLSTSFSILILGTFGIFCFLANDFSFAVLAAVGIGALLPFFLHNVFGYTTKMFVGDGGTMMMGTAISAMVVALLRKDNHLIEYFPELDFSRIAFVVAVLSIPIGDTLRVMVSRMCRHQSPFKADKTHLHHLFLQAGFSYIAISIMEIVLDLIVIGAFFLTWALGASNELQLYVTVAAAAICDFGVAAVLSVSARKNNDFFHKLQIAGSHSHVERKGFWLKVQNVVDNKFENQ